MNTTQMRDRILECAKALEIASMLFRETNSTMATCLRNEANEMRACVAALDAGIRAGEIVSTGTEVWTE